MKTKKCRLCGDVRRLSDFVKNCSRPDGHTNVCSPCDRDRQAKFRIENRKSTANVEMLQMGSVKWL